MLEKLILPPTSAEASVPASWYAALTLAERLPLPARMAEGTAEEEELAARRLARWKQQTPFEQDGFFAERLERAGISEQDLSALLGEAPAALQKRAGELPSWAARLLQACAKCEKRGSSFVFPCAFARTPLVSFLDVCKPLLQQSYECLVAGMHTLATTYRVLPFAPEEVGALLFAPLAERILNIIVKPLTLEVNIARLQQTLPGATSEQRFQAFIERSATPTGLLSFLELYPVLARKLVTILEFWEEYSLEFLTHLCQDQAEIQVAFQAQPDQIVNIEVGMGDTHCQGRSVIQVAFRSGLKLVYKPRSLSIDQHFQELLTWLNAGGDHPPLKAVAVLNRGDHGWAEFVEARTCQTEEELQRFYQRLGGYLALLYALTSTDMHFENVIACGEYPMLIDLESLFQPSHPKQQKDAPTQSMDVLFKSVMRSGLLPRRILADKEADGLDLSGLAGHGGQRLPRPVSLLTATGTDEMHFVQQYVEMAGKENRPTLRGSEIDILDYTETIIAGFTRIYGLVLQRRDDFLALVCSLFAEDRIRVLFRPTRIYDKLHRESLHPTMLRNMLTHERFFDHLWNAVPQLPFLKEVIPAEQQDLLQGDLPLFSTRPDSCDLFTSQGDCLPEFFSETALAQAERTIREMGEADLACQCWIIRASFASLDLQPGRTTWKGSNLQPTTQPAGRAQLLQAALAVGDQLSRQAIVGEHEVTWLNLHLAHERSWSILPTGASLYDGMAGIILFLAYLGTISGEERYTRLARRTFQHLREKLLGPTKIPFGPGAFGGWGGLLYLYAHLGVLWQEPVLFAEAARFLETYQEDIDTDESLDIIGGSAGCLLCLLALQRVAPSEHLLAAALRCGEHLLARAQTQAVGIGWPSLLAHSGQPLTGFSHGNAGIAYSLLELARVSGDTRFGETALSALAYERSLFSPDTGNWPDLRDISHSHSAGAAPDAMLAWCHGAPGIALARLGALKHLDDAATRAEIAVALEATLAGGFGSNHSLCHGDLGNLDILLTAAQILHNPGYHLEVERLIPMLLQSIERQGWCTGVPLSIETPGLMTGIAGIGYALLRLAEPELVPSVLLLAPPMSPLSRPAVKGEEQ